MTISSTTNDLIELREAIGEIEFTDTRKIVEKLDRLAALAIELSQHIELRAATFRRYDNPDDVGWLGWFADGEDNVIAFVGLDRRVKFASEIS